MIMLEEGGHLDITLQETAQGGDRVVLDINGTCVLALTPHQARVLATELIMAVNRAEVRNNLRRSASLTRRPANEALPDGAPGHAFAQ
jgi:hypothetical protein